MTDWLRWRPGRQGTGYRKLLLGQGRAWDCYLIDYPPGASVPEHVDPVPGKRHYRLNVTLLGDPRRFIDLGRASEWPWSALAFIHHTPGWRVVLFRPDEVRHAVLRALARRLVLSVGWVR